LTTAPRDPVAGSVPSVTVYSGYTVLRSDLNGEIRERRHGLYDFDARVVSRHALTLSGQVPELVAFAHPRADEWFAVLRVPRPGGNADGPLLPQDMIEISLRRAVGPAMREAIDVRNHSSEPFSGRLELALDADFVDIAPAKDVDLSRWLTIERRWNPDQRELVFACQGERESRHFERSLTIRVDTASEVQDTSSGLEFELALGSQETWSATLDYVSHVDGVPRDFETGHVARERQRAAWRSRRPQISPDERMSVVFERAADDLFDLRNFELEERFAGGADGSAWVTNAGVPSFTGLFGRDVLTAAWQTALLGPRATHGALAIVAATQSDSDDAWRDAEPGKMIHEMRRGPLSELAFTPRDRYYGTQTTPHMFVLALSELWHWTGEIELLRRYRDAALRAMEWAERYGDLDGDGFLEYHKRSPKGLRNQGWKDSDEAIRHPDGSAAQGPIATVEEQAFHFLALQRMAEILLELGEEEHADEFLRRASALRRHWHDAFWMPEEGFYALALDGSKKQVKSITSNPGHALGTGIVPLEHAQTVADRLMSAELFSGWGIRTLSERHPSYNPFAYHLGTVWPVEQATFALGFKRYGLDEHAERLATALLEAAALMPEQRLPEAISGHARATDEVPVPYPQACSPQAWSAGATIQMLQILLGLYPLAPLGVLTVVRPRLPEWAPEVTLRRLRVGRSVVDLRFDRRPDGSVRVRTVRRRGPLIVAPAGPPVSVDQPTTVIEAVEALALKSLPGSRLRAVRIALGVE
jgi:glycogen debranching enzyme